MAGSAHSSDNGSARQLLKIVVIFVAIQNMGANFATLQIPPRICLQLKQIV